MAVSRPQVAVCGSGLGRYIAEAILRSGRWELIFISRRARPDLTARGVVVRVVNYNSHSSLHNALIGVHTVISTISDDEAQFDLIEACLTAGVRRFAPSEFEGPPDRRPVFSDDGRDKLGVWQRLHEVRSHLQSTAFVCGLFYETFVDGGWVSCGGGGWDRGGFLLDMRSRTATIPEDINFGGANATVCMTSAEDVGRFVCRALEIENWPSELRMYGERLRMKDLIRIAEHVRDSRFRVNILTHEDLEIFRLEAMDTYNYAQQLRVQALQSIQSHEMCFGIQPNQSDYQVRYDLNYIFPDVRPLPLEAFLRRHWR